MATETLLNLALISEAVYTRGNAGPYSLISASYTDNAGQCALAVYEGNGKKILAIKGTTMSRQADVDNDMALIMGGIKSIEAVQPTLAAAKALISKYGCSMITGHSLGGYFCEILCTTMGMAGASFCGPGVNGPFVKLGGSANPNFQNIQFEHDLLGNFNCAAYQHVKWSVYVQYSKEYTHGIKYMVEFFRNKSNLTPQNVVAACSSYPTGYYLS